ncbi:MAG: site-2 protease family protein [Paenisporosarcina sp.]
MSLNNFRQIQLHPIMIPLILYFIGTGQFAHYSIMFTSLIFHEMGHLVAAKWTGLKVKKCIILPYGGEIVIRNLRIAPKHHQWIIAISGPLATSLLYLITQFFSFPGQAFFNQVQLMILAINCLPMLPLDGGQALLALFPKWYEGLLITSIFGSLFAILIFSEIIPVSLLFVFIVYRNMKSWHYRKYDAAFHDIIRKKLTLE